MLELSITNYQMRRPPMATNVRALSDMPAKMVIHASENDYVKKMVTTAFALQKQNQIIMEQEGPAYNLSRNFRDSVGTIYLRENRKIHFEVDTAYTEEIEIKAFFSKKVEKRHHIACISGVIPFTFDHLLEVRISGNHIIFTYSLTPDGKGQPIQYAFEMADPRAFARDLYEWAERKNFKLIKAIDEAMKEPVVDHAPPPPPPQEGVLYSALIEPDNQIIQYGQTMQFSVRPADIRGNPVPISDVKWSVDPPSIGTITQNGLFTPSTDNAKCTIRVVVTSGGVTINGFGSVNIVPAQHQAQQPQQYAPQPQAGYQPGAPPPPPPPPTPKNCPQCGGPMDYHAQYKAHFCQKCQKWA